METLAQAAKAAVRTVHGGIEQAMPEPLPKPPARPPGEPIIIKAPSRPGEAPEIDSWDEDEDHPEIKRQPDRIPEMPPPPTPEERAWLTRLG